MLPLIEICFWEKPERRPLISSMKRFMLEVSSKLSVRKRKLEERSETMFDTVDKSKETFLVFCEGFFEWDFFRMECCCSIVKGRKERRRVVEKRNM